MTKHILKITFWFLVGIAVTQGFGADIGTSFLGGAVWVWLFA